MKLEEIKSWAEQGKDTAAASGEQDKIKAELFENFKINEDICLAEKVKCTLLKEIKFNETFRFLFTRVTLHVWRLMQS